MYNNGLNSFPNDTFLDWLKLKAFAGRVEKNMGKAESVGYQHFLKNVVKRLVVNSEPFTTQSQLLTNLTGLPRHYGK